MQFGIDVWNGSLNIDEPTLKINGIGFIISRMNSITGGLKLDLNFTNQWEESIGFLRAPYFVYTPWETGKTNAEWLLDHCPKIAPRVFPDIEVRKLDYPPATYAKEVEIFYGLVNKYYPTATYTGGWFLDCLAYWPKGDYWWGRYPYFLYPPETTRITWQEFYERLEYVGWYPDPYKLCPGIAKVWQCTGDRYILPGTAERVIDVNVTNFATFEELVAWWGGEAPVAPPAEEPKPTIKMITLISDTRIRSGPSIYSPVVSKIGAGQVLEIQDFGGTNCWAQIKGGPYDGKWIAIQYGSLRLLNILGE